jgi:hypothetical protein
MSRWTDLSPGMRDVLKAIAVVAIIYAMLFIGLAHAAVMISRGDGEARIRLMRTPCASGPVIALLKDEHRPNFQAAEARLSRGPVPGCWILNSVGAVFMVFENGEMIEMPTTAFQLEPGA